MLWERAELLRAALSICGTHLHPFHARHSPQIAADVFAYAQVAHSGPLALYATGRRAGPGQLRKLCNFQPWTSRHGVDDFPALLRDRPCCGSWRWCSSDSSALEIQRDDKLVLVFCGA